MKWIIKTDGKKYRVRFWKFIAYHALEKVERLEKRIESLERKLDVNKGGHEVRQLTVEEMPPYFPNNVPPQKGEKSCY